MYGFDTIALALVRRVQPGEPLGRSRGDVVVCIPVYGAPALFTRCLESVLRHTERSIPILIADDCSPDPEIATAIAAIGARPGIEHEIFHFRQPANRGFPVNCNSAFDSAAPADVVLLNSDVEVAAGWLEGLREAAYSDSVIASATPLTNSGTIVSVPLRNIPVDTMPDGWDLEPAAAAIRRESLRLRPRLPTAIGHCVYFRRPALELVGGFDPAFTPGYGEEVDWSQRCVLRGLSHVLADDVFVFHAGGASFGGSLDRRAMKAAHEQLNKRHFPYYNNWAESAATARHSPLARALEVARRAVEGISVTIDGSSLGPTITGTQVLTLETVAALHREGTVRVRVAVPRNLGDYARTALSAMPGVETIIWEDIKDGLPRTDIVHRPAQVGYRHELVQLRALGSRLLISQLDVIAFRNPGYFDSFREWNAYRRTTRESLAAADQVLFISEHSRADALAEELVEPARAHVVHIGIDHRAVPGNETPARPPGAAAVEPGFLLCLGTDFRHKNRLFALDVLAALRAGHGFSGPILLVGPEASPGSSSGDEREWLKAHPADAAAVVAIGSVTEGEKAWLLANAGLVISPSVYEGFGLVPFEAAAAGVPTLFAAQASMAEVLPLEVALLVPWSAELSAAAAHRLLTDPAHRAHVVATIRAAGRGFTWDDCAAGLLAVYREALALPAAAAFLERAAGLDEAGNVADQASDLALINPLKALRYWRSFGFTRGTRLGLTAFRNRFERRFRPRR